MKKIVLFLILSFLLMMGIKLTVNFQNKKLMKNRAHAIATIYKVDFFPGGSGLWLYYKFEAGAIPSHGRKRLFVEKSKFKTVNHLLLNKSALCVYDSIDSGNNDLIVSKIEMAKYGILLEDSSIKYFHTVLDSLMVAK